MAKFKVDITILREDHFSITIDAINSVDATEKALAHSKKSNWISKSKLKATTK